MLKIENKEKQYWVRDNNTGKESSMPRATYENAKKNPAFHLLERIGTVQPMFMSRLSFRKNHSHKT
jgi:hypothetical protein